MTPTTRNLTIALASSLLLFAAGCEKKPAEPTPGEKLDSAISDVKQAGQEAEHAMDKAGDKIEQKAEQAGQAIDDSAITASVKAKLLAADDLKGLAINVDTSHGVVTLTGPVKSAAARDHALALARETDGVSSVNDQLTIK